MWPMQFKNIVTKTFSFDLLSPTLTTVVVAYAPRRITRGWSYLTPWLID